MILEFSWPNKLLSPNARPHHFVKAREVRKAREAAYYLTRANHHGELQGAKRLKVTFTFCPPDKRRRDLDNIFGSFKPHRDGVSEALGIDDALWNPIVIKWGEYRKHGAVIVELTKDEEE